MKVSVKVGDTVLVNSGKDSGKKGKVLAIKKSKNGVRVLVEGVNIITKAKKARTAQEKSELVKQEAAIDISNVNVVCPLAWTSQLEMWAKHNPEAFKANVKMPPMGYYGHSEKDIGRVCVQLASPDFKYMSGETITLEGGMGLRP